MSTSSKKALDVSSASAALLPAFDFSFSALAGSNGCCGTSLLFPPLILYLISCGRGKPLNLQDGLSLTSVLDNDQGAFDQLLFSRILIQILFNTSGWVLCLSASQVIVNNNLQVIRAVENVSLCRLANRESLHKIRIHPGIKGIVH